MAAHLGMVKLDEENNPVGVPLEWTDMTGASTAVSVTLAEAMQTREIYVTENPAVGDTEEWDIYNFTADAHPIHLHLVRFQVISRRLFDGTPSPHGSVQPWETGYKDTFISYPERDRPDQGQVRHRRGSTCGTAISSSTRTTR